MTLAISAAKYLTIYGLRTSWKMKGSCRVEGVLTRDDVK